MQNFARLLPVINHIAVIPTIPYFFVNDSRTVVSGCLSPVALYLPSSISVAVLRDDQGVPPVRALSPCVSPIKLVARLHNSCIHSVASHIAGVKLHHSLSHTVRHPEFLPPPSHKYRCGQRAGHPKLLQLETPLDYLGPSLPNLKRVPVSEFNKKFSRISNSSRVQCY